jgi:hypothetical protein
MSGIGRLAWPEHGEGTPDCQIRVPWKPLRTAKLGVKETGLRQITTYEFKLMQRQILGYNSPVSR